MSLWLHGNTSAPALLRTALLTAATHLVLCRLVTNPYAACLSTFESTEIFFVFLSHFPSETKIEAEATQLGATPVRGFHSWTRFEKPFSFSLAKISVKLFGEVQERSCLNHPERCDSQVKQPELYRSRSTFFSCFRLLDTIDKHWQNLTTQKLCSPFTSTKAIWCHCFRKSSI